MPPISRVTDIGSGHGSFIPTPVIIGSSDTFSGSSAVARVGDALTPHPSLSPSPPHPRSCATGSTTVFTNSMPTVRLGDSIDCGGAMMTGFATVIVGG